MKLIERELKETSGKILKDQSAANYGEIMMDHKHEWGPLEQSRFGAIVHRKCQVDGCKFVNAYDEDDLDDYNDFDKNFLDISMKAGG